MGKFTVLIFILFVGVLAFFAISNTDTTTVTVPFGETYTISKIGLVLIASAFGALAMLVIFTVRDTRRMVATLQVQRRQKKEEKLQNLYSKAVNALLADDTSGARGYLEDVLKIEPDHPGALLRLGDIAVRTGKPEDAYRHYKKALTASPRNIEALFALADLTEKLDRMPEALEYIEEAIDIDSDNLSALHRKRQMLERTGRWDDLIEVQKAIIKKNHGRNREEEEATLTGYRYEYARQSLEEGKLEKAGKGFRGILKDNKRFIPAYLGMTEVMLQEGESERAVNFLEKAYNETYSPIVLARIEDILINMGEPSRLIRIYRNAVAKDPQDVMLKFFMGKLYYRLEMVDDALKTLSEGEIPEGYPEWHQLLGELYLRRNQCESAVEQFKKTIDMKQTLRLPYCCSNCGKLDEAWSGRCPGCSRWNTYVFNLHGTCKI